MNSSLTAQIAYVVNDQAVNIETVWESWGRSVVTASDDTLTLHNDCPSVPTLAGTTLSAQSSYLHVVVLSGDGVPHLNIIFVGMFSAHNFHAFDRAVSI
jgi:hypothetical protein